MRFGGRIISRTKYNYNPFRINDLKEFKMHRLEIKLNDQDFELLEKLTLDFGFKTKTEFLRNIIRSYDYREIFEVLTYFKGHMHSSDIDLKKMLYLNYKSLILLLSYAMKDGNLTSQEGVENAKKFLKAKEKEFLDSGRK